VRLKITFFALLLAAVGFAQTALTNDAVIRMVKAGLGEDLVISTIKSQPASFTTGPDDLIALKGAGVSDKVIAAMIDRATAATAAPAAIATNVRAPAWFRKSGCTTKRATFGTIFLPKWWTSRLVAF